MHTRMFGGSIKTDQSTVYQNPMASSLVLENNKEVAKAINNKLRNIRLAKRLNK